MDFFETKDVPEYLNTEIDNEGRLLSYTNPDGSHYSHNLHSETIDSKVEKEEGKSLIQQEVSEGFSTIDDVENRKEIVLDPENQILSYRDKKGMLHEEVGIATNKLELSPEGMTDFQRALKESGFSGGTGDWSDSDTLMLPIPSTLAIMNLEISHIPITKEEKITGVLTYWDKEGNYFKKPVEEVGLQGRSSLGAPKKNFAFDLSDCKIKFGNWVMQDSFHIKAWYFDIFRGKADVAYDYFDALAAHKRSYIQKRPWLQSIASTYDILGGEKNADMDFNSEAKGVPAGFPVEFYINGDYYGIMTLNLKKHRDNYAMNKKTAAHIHIDPDSMGGMLDGGGIPWTQFEIRNPKNLVDVNGDPYDGDNPKELTGDTSVDKNSAKVKGYIEGFNTKNGQIVAASSDTTLYETVYDVDWVIDYLIFGNVVFDGDGVWTNTQWCTWDGKKWFPMPYDMDQIFGNTYRGNFITTVDRKLDRDIIGKNYRAAAFSRIIFTEYYDRFKARYKELRDDNIISTNYIMSMLKTWSDKIGVTNMKLELERWPETPCYRKPNTNAQWKFLGENYTGLPSTNYSNDIEYQVDAVVRYTDGYYYQCIEVCQGITPVSEFFVNEPTSGGFFDSLERTEMWLEARIAFLDSEFNYSNI